jgi:hypothetical protein
MNIYPSLTGSHWFPTGSRNRWPHPCLTGSPVPPSRRGEPVGNQVGQGAMEQDKTHHRFPPEEPKRRLR